MLGATPTTNYNYRGTEGGLTSFGRGHDGELFLLVHGLYARIAQLVESNPQPGNLPPLLSDTGIFANFKTLSPAPGVLPYELNLPQWTDGIPARRWISVPTGKTIGFSDDGRWKLPPGTVLVQHFEVPAELTGEGKAQQRLETRVLVVQPDGAYYGVGYRWRPDQSDADLVTIDGSHSFAEGAGDNPPPGPRS